MKVFYAIMSVLFYGVSIIFFVKGHDKMTNYYNPGEFSTLKSQNAYVGGDAYNYIINSNYATSFFLIAAIFILLGSAFLILHHVASIQQATAQPPVVNIHSEQHIRPEQ